MSTRSALAVAGLWLVTVAGASALTWTVISSAGARVGQPTVVTLPTATASSSATPTGAAPRNPGTWTGVGGTLVALCRGEAISLVGATPSEGFRAEVKDRGPQQLEVEFEGRAEEKESHVLATCVGGGPVFTRR